MVGVAFFHEPFDADVSSGTMHAAYQWAELLCALGVDRAAVINVSGDKWFQTSSSWVVREFGSLDEFLSAHENEVVAFSSPGLGEHYKSFDYRWVDWVVFGGSSGLPGGDLHIPTVSGRELYPREAAAIVLSEARWQLH